MKKFALCIMMLAGLAACEPSEGDMEDLNSIPEEVTAVPEV